MLRARIVLASTAAAAGLAVLSACNGGVTAEGPASAGQPAPVAQNQLQTPAPVPEGSSGIGGQTNPDPNSETNPGTGLAVTEIVSLGKVVTTFDGKTLYRFDKDTAKPPKSNCDGDCAKQWPPVLVGNSGVAVNGIDKDLVGTVIRKDGSKQVTLNGWPLYLFAKDTAPGDAKGQGVGGTWFVSTPEGKKAGVTAPQPKSPSTTKSPASKAPSTGGYGYDY